MLHLQLLKSDTWRRDMLCPVSSNAKDQLRRK